jgi:hypothetical protein
VLAFLLNIKRKRNERLKENPRTEREILGLGADDLGWSKLSQSAPFLWTPRPSAVSGAKGKSLLLGASS